MKTRSYNKIDIDLAKVEVELFNLDILNGNITPDYIFRRTHQTGLLVGGYNNIGPSSLKTSPIYAIGSAYMPNDETLGNMYGIGYTNTSATFIGAETGAGWGMYVAADGDARIFLNASTGIAHLRATSADYADIAEKYLGDKVYPCGTVLAIGGTNEVTEYRKGMPLAGVVSTDPAMIMNNGKGTQDDLYAIVALKGKIPCFIDGECKKGQYIIAGDNGKGIVSETYVPEFHLGVALEDSVNGTVMVKV